MYLTAVRPAVEARGTTCGCGSGAVIRASTAGAVAGALGGAGAASAVGTLVLRLSQGSSASEGASTTDSSSAAGAAPERLTPKSSSRTSNGWKGRPSCDAISRPSARITAAKVSSPNLYSPRSLPTRATDIWKPTCVSTSRILSSTTARGGSCTSPTPARGSEPKSSTRPAPAGVPEAGGDIRPLGCSFSTAAWMEASTCASRALSLLPPPLPLRSLPRRRCSGQRPGEPPPSARQRSSCRTASRGLVRSSSEGPSASAMTRSSCWTAARELAEVVLHRPSTGSELLGGTL
mmetsp:Transcript_67699/g.201321  ORF Transcript_67699/g.201321 Transcript_67699/m.201321 type:complete len:291 (+) Transcript_67699:836-1708(+)